MKVALTVEGFAAFELGDHAAVVPVRTMPTASLVPVLRPMLPQPARRSRARDPAR